MKQLKIMLFLFIALSITSCGGASKKESETLKNEVNSLKTTVGDLNWKLEELSNKFMLLQEQRTEESELDDEYGQDFVKPKKKTNTPPTDLKVVTLRKKTKKAPKKEIYIKKEPSSAKAMYREGQNLFLAGQYKKARSKFSKLVEDYPANDLVDNALYWGAESYYSEEKYEKALEIFIQIVNDYSGQNKAPDAMLKVAYAYIELGSNKKAKLSLENLLERYPETNAALKAKKRLQSL